MTRTRLVAAGLFAACFALLVAVAVTRDGAPAVGQPAPTVPCPGCGPGPGNPGPKPFAFAYPEHFCPPELQGASRYTMRYGYGADGVGQATFFVSLDGGPPIKLETLKPGESATSPGIVVNPGETVTVRTWATLNGKAGGPRILFGNGQQGREDVLRCDCPPPGEDTTTSTVPGETTTTVPGETTTTGPAVSMVTTVPSSVRPGTIPASE